jgi:signal transduction histidine kinase
MTTRLSHDTLSSMLAWRPAWPRGRARGHVDESGIRRIGWQLAIVTGLTVSALVVVLGFAVYESAQSALMQQLQGAVVSRANGEVSQWTNGQGPGSGGTHPPGGRRGKYGGGQPPPGGLGSQRSPSYGIGKEPVTGDGVFVSVVNSDLRCVTSTQGGPGGEYGSRIPDRHAARAVLQTGEAQLASFTYSGHTYLSYSEPIRRPGNRSHATQVVQASLSEGQYRKNIEAILQVVLLVGGLGLLASFLITGLVVQRALLPIRSSIKRQRDFVADAAHELRTPLSIIRSAGEMLLRDTGESKREEMAQLTLEETGHLTRLVSDLSLLARSDTGTLDFARDRVNMTDVVRTVSTDMEVLAEDRGVSLRVNAVDQVFITGDRMRMRQLLLILLDNALKHTPSRGNVNVNLDVSRRRARLRVTDSGQGIPHDELNRIFDRFYQSSASRTGEGSGLGLAIAESIVRVHKGEIAAANRQDSSGAVFTVTLPATNP